jgi:uncharacterized protein DUF1360
MNEWLLILLLSLGTYRLTRLVVKDTFPPVLWARDRLVGGWRPLTEQEEETQIADSRAHEDEDKPWDSRFVVAEIDGETHRYLEPVSWSPFWLRELLSCPWCASGWLSLVLVAGTAVCVSVPLPALFWLASWALGALLASQTWA